MYYNEYACTPPRSVTLVESLCDPMDCSSPSSSVHGILQARILAWVAMPSSGDRPDPRIEPTSPALQVDSLPLSHWEAHKEHMTCEFGEKIRKKWEIIKRLKIPLWCDRGPPRAEEAIQRHLWLCPQTWLEGAGIPRGRNEAVGAGRKYIRAKEGGWIFCLNPFSRLGFSEGRTEA